MKFTEFFAGQQISAGPYEVKLDEVLEFARAYDPQWFHVDADAAGNDPFKGLIASGWHTCSIAMRLIVEAALVDSETYASPGLDYVKWPQPVHLVYHVRRCRSGCRHHPGTRLTPRPTVKD
jgi:acyl dehydratase